MLINSTTFLTESFYANVLLVNVLHKGILTALTLKPTDMNGVPVPVDGYLTCPVV